MMKRRVILLSLSGLVWGAQAQTPAAKSTTSTTSDKSGPRRDLLVELRQIEESGAGHVVSTQPATPLLTPQQVRVRNGERALLRVGQSIAVQWVKSAEMRSSSLAAGGATASARGAGVGQELTWLDAGRSLSVRPQWPGGQQPVTLEVDVQSSAVDPHAGALAGSNLPVQNRSQMTTTVSAPLGQWVTIGSSGAPAQRGVYTSEASAQTPRLLQVRVTAP